jgi:hypothetical protein
VTVQLELFATAPSTNPLVGMTVRLDRANDRSTTCCRNLAVIEPKAGPHAHPLRCAICGRHRGWLPITAARFISLAVRTFGAPPEPPIIRDATNHES